jgi:hypothetical protein
MRIPWFDGIDQFRNAKFATVGNARKKSPADAGLSVDLCFDGINP